MPTSPRRASTVRWADRDAAEWDALDANYTHFFSANAHTRVLREDGLVVDSMLPEQFRQKIVDRLGTVRMALGHAAFWVCPASKQQLQTNRALWRMVHDGCFDVARDGSLFNVNVFGLRIPTELATFLLDTTPEELDMVLLDFLVLLWYQLMEENDTHSMDRLREDVLPAVWNAAVKVGETADEGEPACKRRREVLENLVQISFMTPWKIEVDLLCATPTDVDLLLASEDDEKDAARCSLVERDNDSLYRDLYNEWLFYHRFFCEDHEWSPRVVLHRMTALLRSGDSDDVWRKAQLVQMVARRQENFLSDMPEDVINRVLIPQMILGLDSVSDGLTTEAYTSEKYNADNAVIHDRPEPSLNSKTRS